VQSARKVESAGLGDRVEFVSLTVDPARDTPAQLHAYRKLFSPAPKNWTLLTGSPATVHRVLRSLGVYWKKVRGGDSPPPRSWRTNEPLRYDVDHSDELFFVGPESRERFLFDGPPHVSSSSAVPARLRGFMDAEGHHNLRKSAGREWTVPQVLTALSGITGHRIA
jgi:protein SCO1/2